MLPFSSRIGAPAVTEGVPSVLLKFSLTGTLPLKTSSMTSEASGGSAS